MILHVMRVISYPFNTHTHTHTHTSATPSTLSHTHTHTHTHTHISYPFNTEEDDAYRREMTKMAAGEAKTKKVSKKTRYNVFSKDTMCSLSDEK